jgi:hypothetical protein
VGTGDRTDDGRDDRSGSIVDDAFWTDLEFACASAFGWTLDQIYDTLDLPTYLRFCYKWAKHPPLHELPGILLRALGVEPGADIPEHDAPPPPRPQQTPPLPAQRPSARRAVVSDDTGYFVSEIVHKWGATARHVHQSFYDEQVAELDAGRAAMGLPPLRS